MLDVLNDTQAALVDSRQQLGYEKAVRQDQERKIEVLQEKNNNLDTRVENFAETLGNTQSVLVDITNDANKQRARRDHFEKRFRASNAKTSRLQKRMENISEQTELTEAKCNDKNEELTRTQDELRRVQGELWQVQHAYSQETVKLRKELEEAKNISAAATHGLDEQRTVEKSMRELLDIKTREIRRLSKQLEDVKINGTRLTQRVQQARKARRAYSQRLYRAQKRLARLDTYKNQVNETLRFIEKRTYRQSVRTLVRQMVSLGCPMVNIGKILDFIYQMMIKPLLDRSNRPPKICLDEKTVARIVAEGGVAADIQTAHEMKNTTSEYH